MAKAWKKTERPVYGDARTELTAPVREIVVLDDPEEVKSTVSPEPADWTTVDKRNWGVVSEITTYDTPSDNVGGATGEKPNSNTEGKTNEKSEETPKWTPIDEWLVDPVPWSPEDKSKQQDKKWWETAGTTVPQNNQGNTKSWGGTSASNDDWTIKVWEQNANLNYYQYWDDSNPAQQWQKGWMNPKYTGEWVSNSYIEYNPDLTVADLDPNYLYWEAARQQNSKEAGYIARRNDNIASALYNEWLTSREDVANFLSQQKEWMNSTEADRENTIESIYKRLGQMKPQEEKPDLSKADNLVTDTSNTLYGKTTADEWNPKSWIETKVDANSVLNTMEQRRSSELKNFVSTDIQSIASCVVNWTTYWDEQTWRDAQEIYPDFIAAVNAEVKKQRGQQNVTAIASGWEMSTNTDWQSNINNSIAWFWASNATSTKSSVEIAKDVHDSLAKNQTANEASATMEWIEEDMAILKNRLKNLRQEANAAFKWDAPDYLVKAYMNNKTQEIQNQMSILEDRYNAAYNRYKLEVANTQWEKEYKLKEKQLELEEKEYKLKERQVKNWVTEKKDTTSSNARYNQWDKWEVTKMSDEEVSSKVDTLVDMFEKWQLGNAQCGVWIQTYYLPMLWISLNGISTMEQKKSLINEWEWYMPKKWDLIILKGSKSEYWHIWIVTWVSEDGRISYLDWNWTLWEDWNWDWTPQMRWLKSNSEKIIWYRNVNKKNEWTDYDYTRFAQYRDATSKSEKETIAAEYWTDVAWMSDMVRDALENKEEVQDNGDDNESWYDPELWFDPAHTDIYDKINSWELTSKTEVEWQAMLQWISAEELWRRAANYKRWQDDTWNYGEQWKLPWVADNSWYWYMGWDKWYDPSLVDFYKNYWTSKLSQWMYKDMLQWNNLTNAQFNQQRKNYLNDMQVEFNTAWLDLLKKMADFYIAMDDADRIDDGVFDKNWLWQWYWSWAKNAFDAMTNERLLQKYVDSRSKWVTYWSTTEAEWDIVKKTDALTKSLSFWTSDEDFTKAYKSLLAWLWEETTHSEFNNSDWLDFVGDRKAKRDNVIITTLTWRTRDNNTIWWKSRNESEAKGSTQVNTWSNMWTWSYTWTWDFWDILLDGIFPS